jgi:hypothetical protein
VVSYLVILVVCLCRRQLGSKTGLITAWFLSLPLH